MLILHQEGRVDRQLPRRQARRRRSRLSEAGGLLNWYKDDWNQNGSAHAGRSQALLAGIRAHGFLLNLRLKTLRSLHCKV